MITDDSERAKESNQLLLFGGRQASKSALNVLGFAAMTEDRVFDCQRRQIMHEASLRPKPPERHRPKLRRGVLRTSLNDPIAGAYIVQEKVAIRMNRAVFERVWMEARAAGSSGALPGHDGLDVTGCTTDFAEQLCPVFHI